MRRILFFRILWERQRGIHVERNLRRRRKIRRGIYVDSTLKNGHKVDRYFSTSNPRRLNVDIYPAIGKVDLLRPIDVDSTSKVSVQTWYIFQRQINADSTSEFLYP